MSRNMINLSRFASRAMMLASIFGLFIWSLVSCSNPLKAEIDALRVEALAQTKIPVTPTPPTVTPVEGVAGSGKVLISWAAVPGTTSYDVYYSATVSPPPIANGGTNLTGTSTTISGLTNWDMYYFWIIAKNKLGSSSLSIPPATGAPGIKVTSITLNKTAATFVYNSKETIIATITPSTATNPNVNWATSNSAAATVSNGTVTGGNVIGSATITATAADGYGAAATFTAATKANTLNTAGPAGGYLFYDKGSYSDGWRYLEAASVKVGGTHPWSGAAWYGQDIVGAQGQSVGTGKANTEAIVTHVGFTTLYQARDCYEYAQNGYSDWFMPSMAEANELISLNPTAYADVLWSFLSSSQHSGVACWSFDCSSYGGWSGWEGKLKTWADGTTVTQPIRQF